MLEGVNLADQWRAIESELPADWADAQLRLRISDPARADRAGALLGSANPGRYGDRFTLRASRTGGTASYAVGRLLQRLDGEGIAGRVELVETTQTPAVLGPPRAQTSLVVSWDNAAQGLPDDWSDLLVEVELASSDLIPRAALELAPVNPLRYKQTRGVRFRVARQTGYGASAGMARRCLERLDAEGIRGSVRVLRALSETDHVSTQGPVWYMEGKAV
jgi:hypothetical protein